MPWNTSEENEQMEVIKIDPEEAAAANQGGRREQFGDILVPRRVKISKNDLQHHRYTAKCEGCRAAMTGRPTKPHSEECRQRMETLMKENPKMQKTQKRMNEFFDKVGEEQDERDEEE